MALCTRILVKVIPATLKGSWSSLLKISYKLSRNSENIDQNTIQFPAHSWTIQLGHEDPGVFHGHEIGKNNLVWFLGCFFKKHWGTVGGPLQDILEHGFLYTPADITSSFEPCTHLRCPVFLFLI